MNPRFDLLFTFGSLSFPQVMLAVTGRSLAAQAAQLANYRPMLLDGECFPGLAAMPGASTHGQLFQDIDAETWRVLDRFEGDYYQRQKLTITAGTAEVQAFVYLLTDEYLHLLTQAPWDAIDFEANQLAPFLTMCARFRQGQQESASKRD